MKSAQITEEFTMFVFTREKNEISKDNPVITEELREILNDWRRSIEAKVPKKNPKYLA